MNHKYTVPYIINTNYLSHSWKSEYRDKYSKSSLKYIKIHKIRLKIKQNVVPF